PRLVLLPGARDVRCSCQGP
ncbi:hypothetical protein HCJ99_18735, partial [Streptomyces sp. C1-2]|nr:hypothetical protein [Streptomyces sp. C1-2]